MTVEGAAATTDSISIAPLVVTSAKPREQILIDRKVYSITADLQSTTGSLADVLTAIPAIEVDSEGGVALRGSTNVLILVDGRPSAQLSGPMSGANLQQIAASDIDRIEVMANPPPQYKAEGAGGVINIITRKSRRAGASGTLNAGIGNRRRALIGSTASYNAVGLHLSGSANLRQDDRQRQISSDLTAPDPAANALTAGQNSLNEHIRRRTAEFKLSADYAWNERQSLSLSLDRGDRNAARSYRQNAVNGLTTGFITSLSARDSVGIERSVDSDERLSFDQTLRSPDEVFGLTLHRSYFNTHEHYDYTNFHALPPAAPSFDNLGAGTSQTITEFSADYVLPLPMTRKWRLGYDFEKDDDGYSNAGNTIMPLTGTSTINPSLTNNFRYLQQTDAAYATYQAAAGPWNWLGGARVERTRTDARQLTGRVATERGYIGLYPSNTPSLKSARAHRDHIPAPRYRPAIYAAGGSPHPAGQVRPRPR